MSVRIFIFFVVVIIFGVILPIVWYIGVNIPGYKYKLKDRSQSSDNEQNDGDGEDKDAEKSTGK